MEPKGAVKIGGNVIPQPHIKAFLKECGKIVRRNVGFSAIILKLPIVIFFANCIIIKGEKKSCVGGKL